MRGITTKREASCYRDFVKRNKGVLSVGYHIYRVNHDYCVDSMHHRHLHSFDQYCQNEFEFYRQQIQDEESV